MGLEWKRNFVKNGSPNMGKENQEYIEMQTFFRCSNNLLCKQFGLIKKITISYYLAEQNRKGTVQ